MARDGVLFDCWLRAGVLDTFLDEPRSVADVARVALLFRDVLLLFARELVAVLRAGDVAASWLRDSRFLEAAGVVARLPVVTVPLFVAGVVADRVAALARVPLLRLLAAGSTARLLSEPREALVVAAGRVLVRADGVVALVLAVARLFVAFARSPVLAVRDATARTFDASVTRAGRAVFRVLSLTSGRYMFTVRLSTAARPGRELLAIWRTAMRLLVSRWISLCFGPLTYVRLLYTYVLLMIVVRL